MIEAAEKDGSLTPDSVVIFEPTSGNTGIALAFVCTAKGYKCILTMPETMSKERRLLLRLFWARNCSYSGLEHGCAISKASQLMEQHGNKAFMPQQFNNPANPEIHRKTTAEEIWSGMEGKWTV